MKTLQNIVRSFKSDHGSFYVFAPTRIRNTMALWKQELPTVRPFYAVKSNPDRSLLTLLSSLGAGFDCASGRELIEVAETTSSTIKEEFHDRVIYANPCKPLRDLQKARAFGSPITVVDSCEEVEKLADMKWQGGALVRILVDDKDSLMPFSRKFGLRYDAVAMISNVAKQKGIELKGVSFHVGSGCNNPQQYKDAMDTALKTIDLLEENGHESAHIVDIGGGFIPDHEKFKKYARYIRSSIYSPLTRNQKNQIRFIAEPGRFFATNAFDLFVQVIGKKPGDNGWRYSIDESLYGQFSAIPFDHMKPKWTRVSFDNKIRKVGKGTLYGRTCDSLDMIGHSDAMEELEVGDWLWFPHMGAYTSVTASEFNGFPKPPLHGLENTVYLPDLADVDGVFPSNVTTVSAVSIK